MAAHRSISYPRTYATHLHIYFWQSGPLQRMIRDCAFAAHNAEFSRWRVGNMHQASACSAWELTLLL